MSLIFVNHFILKDNNQDRSYTTYYDTGTGQGVVDVTPGPGLNNITLPNAGTSYTNGQFITSFCSDNPATTLVKAYASTVRPFCTFILEENSASCPIVITQPPVTPTPPISPVTPPAPTVPTQQFLSTPTTITIPSGNVSRWNAAFNPIIFNYQRRDYQVTNIAQDVNGIAVTLNTLLSYAETQLAINDMLYLNTANYIFLGLAKSTSTVNGVTVLIVPVTFTASDFIGYLNIPNAKAGYHFETEIANAGVTTIGFHTPDLKGFVAADLSSYLETLVRPIDLYDYLLNSWLDPNLAQPYTIRYRESWNTGYSQWFSDPSQYFVSYAAMQLQELYGGNMAEYVTFKAVLLNKYRAKWLNDMESPTLWLGLPFELSFIYSEYVDNLFLEIIPNLIVSGVGALISVTGGYIISASGSKILINRGSPVTTSGVTVSLPKTEPGIYRVKIPQDILLIASYCTAAIYYLDNNGEKVYVTQTITIKIEQNCNDPYVYLKWVNHLGTWDYWKFGFNQTLSSESTDSVKIKRFVYNWQDAETIEDYIGRSAGNKLSFGADHVDADSLAAMRWLNGAIKAQMLTSLSPVKWQTVIIPDGSFSAYETKKGFADVKLNINLPSKNIQQQ